MSISRRSFLAAAAGAAVAGPAAAQMTISRVPEPGEDPVFFALGQPGNFQPMTKPLVVPFGNARTLVYGPADAKMARLVVFSHGALSDPLVYRQTLTHWATHGYCVAAPVHDDSVFERGLLARRAAIEGTATWEIDKVLNDSVAWEQRIQACQRSLEHPDLLSRAVGFEVNVERPIIIGHEFGAYVAQLMLGAEVVESNGVQRSFRDDRWFGGMLLSPQGMGVMGLGQNSWAKCGRPMLIGQPAKEVDFTGQKPEDKLAAFSLSPAGYKHLAWFTNGRRGLFSGPRAGTEEGEIVAFDEMKATTTAFIRSYADYDAELFKQFAGDWVDRCTLGRVTTRYR